MRFGRTTIVVTLAMAALYAMAMGLDGFSIKKVVKEGQTRTYKLSADFSNSDTTVLVTGKLTEKVTKVEANGNFTVDRSTSDVKVKVGDNEQEQPAEDPLSITSLPNGALVSLDGQGAVADGYRMVTMESFITPDKDTVNVGDSWNADQKEDSKTGQIHTKYTFKVLGEEKIGDFDCVKVSVIAREQTGDSPASVEGTDWIDKADGSLVRSNVQWTNMPYPGNSMVLTGKVKLDRE